MTQPIPGTPAPAAPVPAAAPGVAIPPVTAVPPQSVQPTPGAPSATPQPAAPAQPPAGNPGMVPLHALQEERGKRQALEAEMDQLRRQVSAPQAPMQVQPTVSPVDPKVELEKLWDNDPRKAVQVEIMYAMDWRDRVDAGLDLAADQLSAKYPDFVNYRTAAMGYVRSLPAHQRVTPGILEGAYYMVRGRNVDQLIQQRENELLEKYRRGEITAQQLQTPPGGFSAPAPIPGTVQLSADQLKAAEMMGLTPDMYASQIKLAPTAGAR